MQDQWILKELEKQKDKRRGRRSKMQVIEERHHLCTSPKNENNLRGPLIFSLFWFRWKFRGTKSCVVLLHSKFWVFLPLPPFLSPWKSQDNSFLQINIISCILNYTWNQISLLISSMKNFYTRKTNIFYNMLFSFSRTRKQLNTKLFCAKNY